MQSLRTQWLRQLLVGLRWEGQVSGHKTPQRYSRRSSNQTRPKVATDGRMAASRHKTVAVRHDVLASRRSAASAATIASNQHGSLLMNPLCSAIIRSDTLATVVTL